MNFAVVAGMTGNLLPDLSLSHAVALLAGILLTVLVVLPAALRIRRRVRKQMDAERDHLAGQLAALQAERDGWARASTAHEQSKGEWKRRCEEVVGKYNERARKYNELTTNPAGIITKFIEKPQSPTSTICGIALYYYQPEVLDQLNTYLAEENNADQPGRFVQWLHQRIDVFTYPIGGVWYDIGSYETLAEADRLFSGLKG